MADSAALRRPITVIVINGFAYGVFSLSDLLRWFMVSSFRILNLPVIYVAQPYGGMSPQQMEGFVSFDDEIISLRSTASRA